jgi:plasmid stabilization system protein ParE
MAGGTKEAPRARVRYAQNFAQNLEAIESFWIENRFPQGYDRLLDALSDTVVPNLQRHPRIGRPFMRRDVESMEAQAAVARIEKQLFALGENAEVREYVMDDHVVLYLVADGAEGEPLMVHLLAIKHQKQLGFDLSAG